MDLYDGDIKDRDSIYALLADPKKHNAYLLFNDVEKQKTGVKDCLKKLAKAREDHQKMFNNFPKSHQEELKKRYSNKDDSHHQGAYFELYINQLLQDFGYEVKCLDGTSETGHTPDFLVSRNGKQLFYLECTVSGPTEEDKIKDKNEKLVTNWIKAAKFTGFDVSLGFRSWGAGSQENKQEPLTKISELIGIVSMILQDSSCKLQGNICLFYIRDDLCIDMKLTPNGGNNPEVKDLSSGEFRIKDKNQKLVTDWIKHPRFTGFDVSLNIYRCGAGRSNNKEKLDFTGANKKKLIKFIKEKSKQLLRDQQDNTILCYESDDLYVVIKTIPNGGGPLKFSSGIPYGIEQVNDELKICDDLKKKAKKQKSFLDKELPYVIALNHCVKSSSDSSIKIALFGKLIMTMYYNDDGDKVSCSKVSCSDELKNSFLFDDKGQIINTGVSAVLYFRYLKWSNYEEVSSTLWHHPYAQNPLKPEMLPGRQMVLNEDKTALILCDVSPYPPIYPSTISRGLSFLRWGL